MLVAHLLEIKGLQNKALVFHTKQKNIDTEKEGEPKKSLFLSKIYHDWRVCWYSFSSPHYHPQVLCSKDRKCCYLGILYN